MNIISCCGKCVGCFLRRGCVFRVWFGAFRLVVGVSSRLVVFRLVQ